MLIGCYSLDCYCEHAHGEAERLADGSFLKFPMTYTGKNRDLAAAAARRAGWRIIGDRGICPVCTGKVKRWASS